MPINDMNMIIEIVASILKAMNRYIDKYHIDTNGDGYKCCKVRVRSTKPMIKV